MSMSRWLVLGLALFLFGCGGRSDPAPQPRADSPATTRTEPATEASEKSPPPQTAPTEKAPPLQAGPAAAAPPTWTDDIKAMKFPESPVTGRVNGQPFVADRCELANVGVLTFRQSKDRTPLVEVQIPLPVEKNEVPAGRLFEVTPQGGATVPVINFRLRAGDKGHQTVEFARDYALRLEFGQPAGGKLPGRIYLTLPDASKSVLAGTFTADVEPDYTKPPRPNEAPYVAGKIELKGREKYDVFAGIAGVLPDGSPYANLIGSEVVAGSDFALTSDNFAPQLTTLACDAAGGCTYRHVKLPPGRYLVYARLGDRFLQAHWVEVKADSRLALDFNLDPTTAGTLEATLPKEAKGGVRLVPLDEAGKLPDIKEVADTAGDAMNTNVTAKDGKILLDGLRPGSYRVFLGEAFKDVTVKSKETAKVAFP
jgi:hypothetical protein